MFLYGSQGAGKTHACAAAVKHLWLQGWVAAWAPFEELLLRIRATYKRGGGSEWDVIKPLCEAEVFVLDDLGVTVSANQQETDFSVRILLVLLDSRLANCRKTFITTNKTVEDLGQTFDSRIASRIVELCTVLRLTGEDRRMAKAGGKQPPKT